jgi:hypothetical protein
LWRAEKREKIEILGQPGFEPGMSDYEPKALPMIIIVYGSILAPPSLNPRKKPES